MAGSASLLWELHEGWESPQYQASSATSATLDPGPDTYLLVLIGIVTFSSNVVNATNGTLTTSVSGDTGFTITKLGSGDPGGSYRADCCAWLVKTPSSGDYPGGGFTLTAGWLNPASGDTIVHITVNQLAGVTGTVKGYCFGDFLAGNGAVSGTLNTTATGSTPVTPAAEDVTVMLSIADENTANRYATAAASGNGTWTRLTPTTVPPTDGAWLAYGSWWRTGYSTNATVALDDVNSGNDNWSSAVVAILMEASSDAPVEGVASAPLGGLSASGIGKRIVAGVAAATLGALSATAVGTVAGDGTAHASLGGLSATATGHRTVHAAATANLGFAASAAGHRTTYGAATASLGGLSAFGTGVAPVDVLYPASISGRKLLDQNGDVYLARTFSSWRMANRLSTADITTALEGVAQNGYNGVTVWCGGAEDRGGAGQSRYTDIDGNNFWAGTPWGSNLGPAWAKVDHIVTECARLGMVLHFSFCAGFANTGAGPDWEARTNGQMEQAGIDIATRYAAHPNIVWHIMFDDSHTPGSTRGQRIQALFGGINSVEGSARPVRWLEPDGNTTTNGQGWYLTGNFNATINCWYNSGSEASAEVAEAAYAELTAPVGDCEPAYDGSPHYSGNLGQQLRERSYATFIEGGVLINYGHEDWWPFGAAGLYSEGLDWEDVPAHSHTVQQSYVWALLDEYVATTAWAPTSAFVTTGEGSGDTKAAQGASGTAALAYFPDNRTVAVDTTILAGSGLVRLRWYDPTAGTYTSIAASEAQQSGRSVTLPAARGDGTRDWVLVADLVSVEVEGTASASFGALTATGTGTRTAHATGAASLGSLTGAGDGTRIVDASAAASLGSLTASGDGTRIVNGAATATLGALTAHGSADGVTSGTAAAPLGALTATGTGERTAHATATAPLGFAAAGAGHRTVHAAASATFGFVAHGNGDVIAPGIVEGQATATLGFTASAAGHRATYGTAVATFGFTATATSPPPGPYPVGRITVTVTTVQPAVTVTPIGASCH